MTIEDRMGNVFREIEGELDEEELSVLLATPDVRIERIVSTGQTSPPGFWYDQGRDEWVIVLRGRAALELEGQTDAVELAAGDWIRIRAHERHRVAWTAPDEPTVWLAVHFRGAADGPS